MSRRDGYLLDSHVLLWWWFAPDRLSTAVRELLIDPSTSVLVSAASVWELSLRHHQAELERLVLLSADIQVSTFPCQTLW